MYVCTYVRTYVRMYVCMYVCMYLCMYVCMYMCMCMCVYIYIYIERERYMFVCIYIYIYIYTHLSLSIYPSIYLSISLSLYMYIYIYIYIYIGENGTPVDDVDLSAFLRNEFVAPYRYEIVVVSNRPDEFCERTLQNVILKFGLHLTHHITIVADENEDTLAEFDRKAGHVKTWLE